MSDKRKKTKRIISTENSRVMSDTKKYLQELRDALKQKQVA